MDINIHDYRMLDPKQVFPELSIKHLRAKFEKDHGVLTIKVEGKIDQFFPINDKRILEKSLKYYAQKPEFEVKWFYVEDMMEAVEAG